MSDFGSIGRTLLTVIVAFSWNVTTTHCAFAAATAPPMAPAAGAEAEDCPMHPPKQTTPEPQKKKGCADLLCCKNLPAAKPVIPHFALKLATVALPVDYLSGDSLPLNVELVHAVRPELDTGPPAGSSLIEIVLQRSIPAHAPPHS